MNYLYEKYQLILCNYITLIVINIIFLEKEIQEIGVAIKKTCYFSQLSNLKS
jgi:hypothetical protein